MKRLLTTALLLLAIGMPLLSQQPRGHLPKLSARLQRLAAQAPTAEVQPKRLYALMTFSPDADEQAVLEHHDGRLVDRIGHIAIVDLRADRLEALAQEPAVCRIEAERTPRATMNVTPAQVNATAVYAGEGLPQAFTGRGVVAGSVDVGHDYTHPSFYDSLGQCRIRYVCDFNQRDAEGRPGRVYETEADIVEAQHSESATSQNHGTHVLGIMAGSQIGAYRGMANEADICLADFNSDREEFFASDDGLTSAVCILGFKRIFDYAQAHNQPCVINFSNGESVTFATDHQLENEALNQLVGPGRIIVAAQGNERGLHDYMWKPAEKEQAGVLMMSPGLLPETVAPVDVRTQGPTDVTLGLLTNQGVASTSFSTTELDQADGQQLSATIDVDGTPVGITAQRIHCLADTAGAVYHFEMALPNTWFLYYHYGYLLLSGHADAEAVSDLYVNAMVNSSAPLDAAVDGFTTSWPATLPRVVGVGATTGTFQLARFSSEGPTFDHRIKPDVVAPGSGILSASNSFVGNNSSLSGQVVFNGKVYGFIPMSGTSMATPVVAGAVALWLQAKPDMTPEEVLDVLARSCRHTHTGLDYPNNQYGNGVLDVYAGLLSVLELTDHIPALSRHQPAEASFSLNGRRLTVVLPDSHRGTACLTLYTPSGQVVARYHTDSTPAEADLSALPAGLYAVQLTTAHATTTGSTLVRLD